MSDLIPWFIPWGGRILTLAVVLPGLWLCLRSLRRRQSDTPHCPRCRYNLTGASSPSCPECGFVAKSEHHKHRQPRRWWLVMVGLLLAVTLPVYVVQKRVRRYGLEYYTYVGPVYWVSPEKKVSDEQIGPFRLRQYVNRQPAHQETILRLDPGNIQLEGIRRWHWDTSHGGKVQSWQGLDIDANGKPDLVIEAGYMAHNREVRRYELINGKTVLAERFRHTGGHYVNAEAEHYYSFVPERGDILVFDPDATNPAIYGRTYDGPQ